MKTPLIEKLNIPELISAASHLALDGKLAISDNNLVYLDVDDAYIHRLFPLLQNQQIKKPDYFGEQSAGAHITVIYPEENKTINKNNLDQKHDFIIKNIVTAQLGLKTYYVLLVESSSLLQLRRKYKLPDLLCFKGYSIGFHITIGVKV
ncbi:MAG: hypothetical protein A3F13_01155 [Gammaproteobacteria bacterium RIFCSPHIGHO2_12_FULL_40_19]|nr:MAG: hypothetical protein A3F13_01155 [Gammaproteobacteria bacterium RIFCSPHIGHO2_12_FULL_40_19]HLB42938.1 hypothetical protein [Gammaproteobacteria bacterium]